MSKAPTLLPIAVEMAAARGFTDVSFVGKGAFKETFRVFNSIGSPVALKLSDPNNIGSMRSEREINALKKCDTPRIGKLYENGIFRSGSGSDYSFSIEEFLDGGTLTDRMSGGPLDGATVREYGISLIEALDHLKGINLVHRDIKPDNIMFRSTDPAPVLVDFGLVRDLSDQSLTQTWLPRGPGTPYYSSPEQLNNEKQLISWKSDQFSLGIVLGMCLTDKHPFQTAGDSMQSAVAAIASRQPCTPDFRSAATALGFDGLIKMVAPWPIQRFQQPAHLLAYFENLR